MSASTHQGTSDLARAMGPVAVELMGEPSEKNQAKREWRWGTRGSFSVSLEKGTWYDNEAGGGGGVLDLIRAQKGLDKNGAIAWMRERGHLPEQKPADASVKTIAKTYDYVDANDALIFQVVRYEPKDFRQRHPNGKGGWIWKMKGVKRAIYHLPAVVKAVQAGATVYVAEGEKAVEALAQLGITATCSPGGAGKWAAEYGDPLRGADVVLLPDNDEAGRKHVADVRKKLKGIAGQVRTLALPDLPEKGDAADWIAAGGTREALEQLLSNAKPTDPDTEAAVVQVIKRFNEAFMVVNEAGKAVILQPGHDPVLRRRFYYRLTTRDLHTLYMNERIQVGIDQNGKPVMKAVSDVWLLHRDRRQFIRGVTFDPTNANPDPGVLNMWEGFAIKPAPGDWSLMRSHIFSIICDSDKARFDYLMGWMARMMQRPAEQGEVAVVMKGGEGTGKGTLARALKHIIGHHALAISNAKHLVGNFNAHLRDAVFLFADEAFFAGDRAHVGVLKSLITEPYLTIEAKFQNALETPNFLHVMMASNEDWVVPAALDSRRFFLLEVIDTCKDQHEYFAKLWAQMEAGGYAAMLHDLLAMDLTNFNVRAVPVTEGLQQQRKLSLPTAEGWWKDCLERGYVFRSRLGLEDYFGIWHEEVATELLFASYSEFADKRRERHPMSREAMGKFLHRVGFKPIRSRHAVIGEHIADESLFGGMHRVAKVIKHPRPPGYSIGSIASARDAFTSATGLSIAWPDDGEAVDETDARPLTTGQGR